MQEPTTTVALLISTYNWPEALELVLISIAKQTLLPHEVVIADDGSNDQTKLLIGRFRSDYQLPIKHIWHEDKGFRKSLILNKAVAQINSSYIIEIDGDIITNPHFVEDHLKVAETGYFIQGSRVMIKEEKSKEILHTKSVKLSVFSSGLYSKFNALRVPLLSQLIMLLPSNPYHIKACNIAFWKSDYVKINGYDNRFVGWGGEDYEFAARLIHSGLKRKRLKMAAIGFHIYHPDNSRHNTLHNDKIYRKTMDDRLTTSPDGFMETNNNN